MNRKIFLVKGTLKQPKLLSNLFTSKFSPFPASNITTVSSSIPEYFSDDVSSTLSTPQKQNHGSGLICPFMTTKMTSNSTTQIKKRTNSHLTLITYFWRTLFEWKTCATPLCQWRKYYYIMEAFWNLYEKGLEIYRHVWREELYWIFSSFEAKLFNDFNEDLSSRRKNCTREHGGTSYCRASLLILKTFYGSQKNFLGNVQPWWLMDLLILELLRTFKLMKTVFNIILINYLYPLAKFIFLFFNKDETQVHWTQSRDNIWPSVCKPNFIN